MVLPDFIVVGSQRCGTTWLDKQLRNHPEIYLPNKRKEPHFFEDNNYYSKGIEWYSKTFFPKTRTHKAIGEITPDYLVKKYSHERLYKHLPDIKLVAIFRNPVDRLFSAYARFKMHYGIKESFQEFIENRPGDVNRGFYADQLRNLYRFYPKHRVKILIFEEVLKRPLEHLKGLADYLGVSSEEFNESTLDLQKRGEAYIPRFHYLRVILFKINEFLRVNNMDSIANIGKKLGVKEWFKSDKRLPPISERDREYLKGVYSESIRELEKLLSREIPDWH